MSDRSYIHDEINVLLAAIDNKDWDSLAKLLHDKTIYEVSGFPRFEGKQAVLDYYTDIRPIENGKHTIESLMVEEDKGICCGRFVGKKKDGEVVDVLFADEVSFESFKITKRRVYYCLPENE